MTDASPHTATSRSSRLGPVGLTADAFIRPLQRGYRDDIPGAVATLARLRRGAGKAAHAVPDLWGLTGMDELTHRLEEWDEEKRARFDPDHAEEALHLAVTLWALHQQSHRDVDMHARDWNMGAAVRALMGSQRQGQAAGEREATAGAPSAGSRSNRSKGEAEELVEPLRRRLVRLSTANAIQVLSQRLREMVLLLRREALPLDYALLADQIYRWQSPAQRAEVHRAWGRGFHLAGGRRLPAPRAAEAESDKGPSDRASDPVTSNGL